jgi:hypothetical protein
MPGVKPRPKLASCAGVWQCRAPGIPRQRLAFRRQLKRISFSRWILSAALLGLSLCALGGCAHHYIPNTDVEDSDFNRGVIEFCEQYRRAVERRNTAWLMKVADPSYYEDGGNVDASDDLDYAGLKDYLDQKFNQTRAIRYEIHYRRVSRGRKDTVLVDYTYSASYKIPTARGDVWRHRVADNRMELVRDGENFRILAGM